MKKKFKLLKIEIDKFNNNQLNYRLKNIIDLPIQTILNLKKPFCLTTWFKVYDKVYLFLKKKNIKKINNNDLDIIDNIIENYVLESLEKAFKIYGDISKDVLSEAFAFVISLWLFLFILFLVYIYNNYEYVKKQLREFYKKKLNF